MTGTSMAAPYVTATLALIKIKLSKFLSNNTLSDELVSYLCGTAKKRSDNKVKYGTLNVSNALENNMIKYFLRNKRKINSAIEANFEATLLHKHENEVSEKDLVSNGVNSTHQIQINLNHFRTALKAHPEAERFVIATNSNRIRSIEPQADDPNNSRRNNDENIQIINTLKKLILPGVADDLLKSDDSSASSLMDPLSATQLKAILERVNEKYLVSNGTK